MTDSERRRRIARRAVRREKIACARMGAKHLGGPDRPDCVLPSGGVADVKHYARNVSMYDVDQTLAKPAYRGAKSVELCTIGKGGFSRNVLANSRASRFRGCRIVKG